MPTNFDTLDYLHYGNEKQQRAYAVLTKHRIFLAIQSFDPILVGTIPINIDIESSDLDVICYFTNKQGFMDIITQAFRLENKFTVLEKHDAVVANFFIGSFEIEIFAQNIPTKQQLAYRHMMIEQKLLLQHGEKFRQQIIELKRQGHKTEPAFAIALGLKGDPYEVLLAFEN